jgi:hypothetical protein
MEKPKFYQAVLRPMTDEELKKELKGCTLSERMGTEEAKCFECGQNKWYLFPKESCDVRVGGKPYIACLNCGFVTHL